MDIQFLWLVRMLPMHIALHLVDPFFRTLQLPHGVQLCSGYTATDSSSHSTATLAGAVLVAPFVGSRLGLWLLR